jgi:uncharacterized protein YdiU (UPF0061 family)
MHASIDSLVGWRFDPSYQRLPGIFYTQCLPLPVRAPSVVVLNHAFAQSIGLDLSVLASEHAAQLFAGNTLPAESQPLAQAYAGHQFGHFTMLGDGRAHLLGEHITPDSKRFDVQFKGSGPTPYSRRGDGRAALGPMVREYIISEAMHALGIPTTRSLAVVTTGEPVLRDGLLQGAILTRVASSHLRVGTFEFIAAHEDVPALKQLADHAIARHYPELQESAQPYHALLEAVLQRQAALVASWMQVGFIHGVMNTDNMAISGETIDYGPCAFMDRYDPNTVFSSIDRHGRYAYANQPIIAQWNLARFAETLVPLLHEDMNQAVEIAEASIERFGAWFQHAWLCSMRKKLGLFGEEADDLALAQSLLAWMQKQNADYTNTFRDLCGELPNHDIYQDADFQAWHQQWMKRRARNNKPFQSSACLMRANNPAIIPRNHQVEAALEAAEQGELSKLTRLLAALAKPYEDLPEYAEFAAPPPAGAGAYQTFCGT